MDLTKFNLEGLQSLHISFKRILKNHEEQLLYLTLDDKYYEITKMILEQKIDSFKVQINSIEQRIAHVNKQKLRFSVEYMQWYYGTSSRSVQVEFLTTSDAYKIYGPYVTGQVLLEKSNIPDLIERVRQEQNNDGVIKFQETVSDIMTEEVRLKLQEEGFMASEIDCIY